MKIKPLNIICVENISYYQISTEESKNTKWNLLSKKTKKNPKSFRKSSLMHCDEKLILRFCIMKG